MLAGCPTFAPDFAIVSLGFGFARRGDESEKNVIERGIRPNARFQFRRSADGGNPATVDQRNAVAELVDFIHVMRCHDHRSIKSFPEVEDMFPDCLASTRIK